VGNIPPEEGKFRDQVFYGAMKGMTDKLDKVSDFFDPKRAKAMRESTAGEFGGIGIHLDFVNGNLVVLTPLAGTPAFRAGVLAGDRIIQVDGNSTDGWSWPQAMENLRGKPGSTVVLTVLHEDAAETTDISIVREIIKIESVEGVRMLDAEYGIGYLRINQFQTATLGEFDNAVERLKGRGLKSLVLDLRNNPGGLLQRGLQVANRFVKEGVLLKTVPRSGKPEVHNAYSSAATLADMPLVVLVNARSASASEILAAALYDHARAVLVGERTYGKGSVQTRVPVPDSEALLQITTAFYYTPKGCSVHRGQKCRHKGACPHKDNTSKEELARGGFRPHVEITLEKDEWNALYRQMADDLINERKRQSNQKVEPEKDSGRVADRHIEEALGILRDPARYRKILSDAEAADGRSGY
jgi:carboxyl-terminal processing protease